MLLAPPASYEGSLAGYIEDFVVPNLPSGDQLAAWTEALLAYHLGHADPVCIVRGKRRGELRVYGGVRQVDSDNSPGIWMYLRSLDASVAAADVQEVLLSGELPVFMTFGADERAAWTYGKPLPGADARTVWGQRLKHCHLLPAKSRRLALTARQLALRNLCPANHFLFPSPKSFTMQRIGWSEASAVADLGESERVIAMVQNRIADRFGASRPVFLRYLSAAGGSLPARPPDGVISVQPRQVSVAVVSHPAGPRRRIPVTVALEQSVPDIPFAAPMRHVIVGTGKSRRWTLNAQHGCYVVTGLTDAHIQVTLSSKDADAVVSQVAAFALDLPDLASRGLVTRRLKDGEEVFDVRIVRDSDASFWLSVRNSARLRLA